MTRAFGPDLHETAVIYTLFDYFLDLWPSLKILLDFFRISSDRRDVSLENHENARWLLGKSGPACRRDARKHKVICSRWRSKRAPQGNPKSTKILDFLQNWCGVRLASSWLHFGSVLASAWLENHENVVFYNLFWLLPSSFNWWPSKTQFILLPFWRLLGSCSRLAAYAFHGLWWPDLHENNVLHVFVATFWPRKFLSKLFWQTLPLAGKSRKRCILNLFDNFRAPGVV